MKRHFLVSAALAACAGLAVYAVISNRGIKAVANREMETIKLPGPKYDGAMSVEKALAGRRSVRSYTGEPLTLAQLSQLLWAAQGITSSKMGLRSAPSAGALYPLEVYVVVGKVDDLSPGVYEYAPQGHTVTKLAEGDKRSELARAALGQSWMTNAPAILVFSAVYERTTGRYGKRGVRYVDMEIGHAGENVYLQAVALGLGTCAVGAFSDDEVKKVMKLPDSEAPLYIMPVGKPR